MFLIIGISRGDKKLEFTQKIICSCCGRYGSYEVYMTYSFFSLFFVPLIKWDRRYFVKTTCCHCECEIDRELGNDIRSGVIKELSPGDLQFICSQSDNLKQCRFCGFAADQDFRYCPKCGKEL